MSSRDNDKSSKGSSSSPSLKSKSSKNVGSSTKRDKDRDKDNPDKVPRTSSKNRLYKEIEVKRDLDIITENDNENEYEMNTLKSRDKLNKETSTDNIKMKKSSSSSNTQKKQKEKGARSTPTLNVVNQSSGSSSKKQRNEGGDRQDFIIKSKSFSSTTNEMKQLLNKTSPSDNALTISGLKRELKNVAKVASLARYSRQEIIKMLDSIKSTTEAGIDSYMKEKEKFLPVVEMLCHLYIDCENYSTVKQIYRHIYHATTIDDYLAKSFIQDILNNDIDSIDKDPLLAHSKHKSLNLIKIIVEANKSNKAGKPDEATFFYKSIFEDCMAHDLYHVTLCLNHIADHFIKTKSIDTLVKFLSSGVMFQYMGSENELRLATMILNLGIHKNIPELATMIWNNFFVSHRTYPVEGLSYSCYSNDIENAEIALKACDMLFLLNSEEKRTSSKFFRTKKALITKNVFYLFLEVKLVDELIGHYIEVIIPDEVKTSMKFTKDLVKNGEVQLQYKLNSSDDTNIQLRIYEKDKKGKLMGLHYQMAKKVSSKLLPTDT